MTEDEAKTKWCPFARVAGQMGSEAQGTSFNRWTTGAAGGASDPAACIGSACMAWKWRVGFEPETLEHIAAAGRDTPRAEGRCGLVGGPQ